ncbi:MAG: ABC transporter substrate-binding protein, partial [Propionibacteriaceae bacterium]|nr:ABC transporter substrate-binding protein [Propionibacteriaceae bacterium]
GVYTAIDLISQTLGDQMTANTLVTDLRDRFDQLAVHPVSGTIYYEVSPLEYCLWTAGQGSFLNEIGDIIGLTNCFAEVSGWAEISAEQVLACDPDYILTITMYDGSGLSPADEISQRPGWSDIKAVKNNAILNLPDNEMSRPGPRLADGAEALASFVSDHQS